MKLVIFEDYQYQNLYPLNTARPSFLLYCGTKTLYQKIVELFKDKITEDQVYCIFREHLFKAFSYLKRFTPSELTDPEEEILFVNGSILFDVQLDILSGISGCSCGVPIIFKLKAKDCTNINYSVFFNRDAFHNFISKKTRGKFLFDAKYISYPFHLVEYNGQEIEKEFKILKDKVPELLGMVDSRAFLLGDSDNLFVGKSSVVYGGVTLDCRDGPIIIGDNTHIKPFSIIEGPCFIGSDNLIESARIHGCTSIFGGCKVSGEVEKSIFSPYTNKHHDGFIGHSYLGSFVNLGAMTTNSDLKNNYNEIRINQRGNITNTGLIKVGCYIGDHSKLGIGSLINTGSVIGFGCNLFFEGELYPKEVPSFSWGGKAPFKKYDINRFIENTQKIVQRRSIYLSSAEVDLMRFIYQSENG